MSSQSYALTQNIAYRDGESDDPYMQDLCRLDIYHPTDQAGFPTLVWFHGGGLVGGEPDFPDGLRDAGIAAVTANYRLSPQVKTPAFIEDAAAAVAWTYEHIADYGGDPTRIFVGGHSAGAYLAAMLGLDKQWLAVRDIDADSIVGLIPLSAQLITHQTVRAESDIPNTQPTIDQWAPLYHIRGDAPPILLATGDRDLELLARYEENAYFWRMIKLTGHTRCELIEIKNHDHCGMLEPSCPDVLRFIRDCLADRA